MSGWGGDDDVTLTKNMKYDILDDVFVVVELLEKHDFSECSLQGGWEKRSE